MTMHANNDRQVLGEFVTIDDERYYAVHNVDQMPAFFISVVSDSDHWLFVSSTGGLTAGRVSPETALFPYVTVDKIHESTAHTGPKTIVRVKGEPDSQDWEPFNREHDGRFNVQRHIYKSVLGNKLCFEELNHDLQLGFRYTWVTSDQFGFARQCQLTNYADSDREVEMIDGLQNILPAGTPRFTQTNSSNLVDAYKWTELHSPSKLAFYTLYSGITDRAEPCEALKANSVFCLGLDDGKVLLSSEQLADFRQHKAITQEPHKRGIRGAYLVYSRLPLAAGQSKHWQMIANLEQSQNQVVALIKQLADPASVAQSLAQSVANGSNALSKIMASADGFQCTAHEEVSVHHYANVLFNVLRGGIFDNQYSISTADFSQTVATFNKDVARRHHDFFSGLAQHTDFIDLLAQIEQLEDPQLTRLSMEYLPITFGRRHGDPSRPWNQFAIRLKDQHGEHLLSYQGNWRDIFQNWEALTFSYPEYIESVIAKFVNASTMDGYNPYRITKEGIDWEVEEPDDPWSYIGYWGDHQIIYLLKLLELSKQFHPDKLNTMLHQPYFCYANVPYRIKSYQDMLKNAKSTVEFDEALAQKIEHTVQSMGADGKLVLDELGHVYQVNLLEKLLVPLLCKLGNLVVDGGIWLNAQRPEWNDANNALVGQGLSMVTLYYMRRYVRFLQELLSSDGQQVDLSIEVNDWLIDTLRALDDIKTWLTPEGANDQQRRSALDVLGEASSRYRAKVYAQQGFSGKTQQSTSQINALLASALSVIDHSIEYNHAEDGLYHAYNLLDLSAGSAQLKSLYPMLEGQVAALSSGAMSAEQAVEVLESLFDSEVYRADQQTFMLYPDRPQTGFLDKNRIPAKELLANPLAQAMLAHNDRRIITQDANGDYRFNPQLTNADVLKSSLTAVVDIYDEQLRSGVQGLLSLYEQVFNHQSFTGRSGGMFGFEGLGCIYWHMVAKLLLAVEENFFAAVHSDGTADTLTRLGRLYYQVRQGIGFNKTPLEYGAFPTDPYSHTPKHAGAQQPGMTGQVKEEVLSRFAELGVQVKSGRLCFEPRLLKAQEFLTSSVDFTYLDVAGHWQRLEIAPGGLAFTWCQVPIIYQLATAQSMNVQVTFTDGSVESFEACALSASHSREIFRRSGVIRQLNVTVDRDSLFKG